jgi:hypothetical protein
LVVRKFHGNPGWKQVHRNLSGIPGSAGEEVRPYHPLEHTTRKLIEILCGKIPVFTELAGFHACGMAG